MTPFNKVGIAKFWVSVIVWNVKWKHYTVTKIIPLSNLLEPNIMDSGLWLDLGPNILDSSINLWVKDTKSTKPVQRVWTYYLLVGNAPKNLS